MSSEFTERTVVAELHLELIRRGNLVQARVRAALPGVDTHERSRWADLSIEDEAWSWFDDFHGESKAWRALLECVADDWCGAQRRLPV